MWPGGAGWRGRRGSAAPRDRTDGTPRGTGCVGVRPMGSRGSYPALSGCLGCGGIKRGVAIGCQREPRLVLAATSDAQAWRMAGSDRSVQRFYMILLVRLDCALVPSGKDRDGRWRSVRDQHEYIFFAPARRKVFDKSTDNTWITFSTNPEKITRHFLYLDLYLAATRFPAPNLKIRVCEKKFARF